MKTLQRAVAEIRELELEEIDLVAGAMGFCTQTSEVQQGTNSPVAYAINGVVSTHIVQDDMSVTTTSYWGWD